MDGIVAAICANLEVTPLGTRSRLAQPLDGVPILRRTVDRVLRSKRLEGVAVLVPKSPRLLWLQRNQTKLQCRFRTASRVSC